MTDDANPPPMPPQEPEPEAPHEPTYPVDVGARALHKSRRWYEQQLKTGRLPGHKAGRSWFLTAGDIAAAIESTKRPAKPSSRPNTDPANISPRPRLSRPRANRRRRPIPPQPDRR